MDKIEHKDANSTDAGPMKGEATPGQTIVLERRYDTLVALASFLSLLFPFSCNKTDSELTD
jgi:hypothetical protein